ncbi:MAG TPA: A24 family peptidase [Myxococcales bacterium]|jgi:prepilin peptidase CpaA
MSSSSNVVFALLGALLAAAVVTDLAARRIPNGLVVAVAATGLFLEWIARGLAGVGSGLLAFLITGLLLWGPWAAGRLGGGDMKLAAATAIALGHARLPIFLLGAALAGGFVAVGCYLASSRTSRTEVRANLTQLALAGSLPSPSAASKARSSVPYAIAIAAGAVAALRWGA